MPRAAGRCPAAKDHTYVRSELCTPQEEQSRYTAGAALPSRFCHGDDLAVIVDSELETAILETLTTHASHVRKWIKTSPGFHSEQVHAEEFVARTWSKSLQQILK